jgi:hypothetical protein
MRIDDLRDKMRREDEKPEPKWPVERRREISKRMALTRDFARDDALRYIRERAVNLAHFFDHVATEADIQHVERLLGIRS